MRCAFLMMDNTDGWSIDAGLCIPHLETLGWKVEWVPWRRPDVCWDSYGVVYVAATWDYPDDPVEFMRVLERIASSSAVLVNDIELVRWNLVKTYLRDLQSRGTAIVPSLWYEQFNKNDLCDYFDQLGCEKIIVKPVISANAANTFVMKRSPGSETIDTLRSVFADRAYMVQPFIENIRIEGEFSLFYLDGDLSHAVCKTPKPGDFRVQEEHGGSIVAVEPDQRLRSASRSVMRQLEIEPAYARVDFVRGPDGSFLLMELELIEPSMYLCMEEGAAQRFADALSNYLARANTV